MLRLFIWPAFILVIIAQWWVPGQMIWKKEKVLNNGTSYKFQSAPVDPSDPFRGKYIILNFKEDHITMPGKPDLAAGSKVFVNFFTDKNGFARIRSVNKIKPHQSDYLETTVSYISNSKDSTEVYLHYPFSNYYMEEYKAPQAEKIYREAMIDSAQRTYALVNLLNGDAVIKDVYINDTLIQQVINKRNTMQ
jgi:uncharacterized membrane-anchored protein